MRNPEAWTTFGNGIGNGDGSFLSYLRGRMLHGMFREFDYEGYGGERDCAVGDDVAVAVGGCFHCTQGAAN